MWRAALSIVALVLAVLVVGLPVNGAGEGSTAQPARSVVQGKRDGAERHYVKREARAVPSWGSGRVSLAKAASSDRVLKSSDRVLKVHSSRTRFGPLA